MRYIPFTIDVEKLKRYYMAQAKGDETHQRGSGGARGNVTFVSPVAQTVSRARSRLRRMNETIKASSSAKNRRRRKKTASASTAQRKRKLNASRKKKKKVVAAKKKKRPVKKTSRRKSHSTPTRDIFTI